MRFRAGMPVHIPKSSAATLWCGRITELVMGIDSTIISMADNGHNDIAKNYSY